ncbi:complement C1q tumor necrosis factor-related protein 3-like [Littorina saxatilis]|uniref:C1q domain-containing protein n=1 Tax=Littorina saxatilis TaxID=31220 RepID=A0AAN9G204_9CAEN
MSWYLTTMLLTLLFLGPVAFCEGKQLQKRSDDIPALKTVVERHSQQMADMIAELTAVKAELNAVKTNVAFHARHSSDPFSVASQGTIVYDNVVTNIGDGYDIKSGIFTAPVSGTYVFFANCMAVVGTSEEAYITLGGVVVGACYSWEPQGSEIHQGAGMATVHVLKGQAVRVQLLENAENVRGGHWNSFSGFLVRADF